MFALIDCNNFYASCERLFRPDLHQKPIIVLSNNDGCVIARSNEAKSLGIKMGDPYFKVKSRCQQHCIQVFSSNYTLYGDLSHRVMSVIQEAWPLVEIYSIDEAFLDLKTLPADELVSFCRALQKQILKYTGIPTSIGIGATKTLSKLANRIAKSTLMTPVVAFTGQEDWLAQTDVADVWGIGRQWGARLHQLGIQTALQLKNTDPHWIKRHFNVTLQRTVYELSGVECLALEDVAPRQSIQCSRSFGVMQTTYDALSQAISHHCARAFETLRKQQLVARHLLVFIQSNRFRPDLPYYSPSIGVALANPTDDLMRLTKAALQCLKLIYRSGIHYQKAGVMLTDLSSNALQQGDLFESAMDEHRDKRARLMQLVDETNRRFGRHCLHLASEGVTGSCEMRSGKKSPCYTTDWAALPRVRI